MRKKLNGRVLAVIIMLFSPGVWVADPLVY